MFRRLLRAVLPIGLLIMFGVTCGGPPAVPSAPPVPQAQPVITSLSPSTASTSGGANIVITGTGFSVGATVTLGGVTAGKFVIVDPSPTVIEIFQVTPHAAGTVDAVVTNPGPGGLSGRLAGGFEYALPESMDFNGAWEAVANNGTEDGAAMRFTIRDGALVDLSCGTSGLLTLSVPAAVSGGAFDFLGSNGSAVTGRIVSPSQAMGTINIAPCVVTTWFADKKSNNAKRP
jgi:hypothetical protein